jgi:hypothetical protein
MNLNSLKTDESQQFKNRYISTVEKGSNLIALSTVETPRLIFNWKLKYRFSKLKSYVRLRNNFRVIKTLIKQIHKLR